MLADIKNDLLHLLNILESIEKIIIYTDGCESAEQFYEKNDQLNFNASLNLLANIGEIIGKVSDLLKQKYQDIPWKDIKNYRNRVVPDCVNIDMFVTFDIIEDNLP